MQPVRIRELRARLAQILRVVQRGGSVTVVDRGKPIARIVAYDAEATDLVVRRAVGQVALGSIPLPEPYATDLDIVALLLEERQGRR